MKNSNSNKTTKKSVLKMLSWLSFIGLSIGGIAGITFGAINFAKYGSKNKGTGYTDSLQTQLQYALPKQNTDGSPLTDEQSLNYIEDISNKMSLIAKEQGVEQIQIQSGIQKDFYSSNTKDPITIGNIYWHTSKVLMSYDFNFDFTPSNEDEKVEEIQARYDNLKLTLYYRLSNNYNYYLQDLSKVISGNNADNNPNFENNVYKLNNASDAIQGEEITKAYKTNDNQLMFNLRPNKKYNPDNQTWNLSSLQQQFSEVYSWDGDIKATSREDVINNVESNPDSSVKLVKPKTSYIFFHNRNGLISLLQNLTTVAALYDNRNLNESQLTRANELYKNISGNSEYASFMEWTRNKANNGGYDWNLIMTYLFNAQKMDFSIQENNGKDPLIELLNAYYTSSIYRNNHELEKKYNDYEFLYSWNFKKDTFINQYLYTIDYYNWFKYFEQDATKEQLEDKDYVKDTYVSKKINTNWSIYNYSIGSLNSVINLLNKASIEDPLINFSLAQVISQNVSQQSDKLYNAYYSNFLDKFITTIPGVEIYSITNIHPFIGAMIALTSLVIIIGIIVSILYRVPGLIMSFGCLVSFGLTLLLFTNLHITFAVSAVFALVIGIIAMTIPFIISMKEFKNSFRNKKLNLNNSFKKFIACFIKTSIIIGVTILIIALVFLFFGSYQIQSFGAALTLIGINNFAICFIVVLVMISLLYYLKLKQKPILMFSKQDVDRINSLKKNIVAFEDEQAISLNRIDRISNKISSGLVNNSWVTYSILITLFLISFVGVILLATIGPARSLFFEHSYQIQFIFANTDANMSIANELVELFRTKFNDHSLMFNVYYNIYPGFNQFVLVPTKVINVNDIYSTIQSFNPKWIEYTQVLSINTFFSNLLTKNSISCLFIALGFLAIFNMFMFNIVNIIPMLITSLASLLVSFGFVAIIRISLNLDSSSAFNSSFILVQILLVTIFTSFKKDFDMKSRLTLKELLNYSFERVQHIFNILMVTLVFFVISVIIMILFESSSNIFNYLMMLLNTVLGLLMILLMSPFLFSAFMYIREVYLSKVIANKEIITSKIPSYDKVDEQIIPGINHS